MEPTDALYNVVEASLALAGFAGIVTALSHHSSGQWRLDDRDRIVNLLLATLLPFVSALLALVLIYANVTSTWRISSACFALLVLGSLGVAARGVFRARRDPEISINPVYVAGVFALVAASLTLQLVNLLSLNTFWPFFAGLAISLSIGASQFVRLLWSGIHRGRAA